MITERERRAVSAAVDAYADEMVAFAADLVRIPTVNPPGNEYGRCAQVIGDRLERLGFHIETFTAESSAAHTPDRPRVNVVGTLRGNAPRPCVHLNGHFDVVPPGEGWTTDPFGGEIRDGRLFGRGSSDMKSGLAAAVYAGAALHASGVPLRGTVEVSGTVDEESGGFAGVGHLAREGRIGRDRTDFVIIPEPFGIDRICVGHRGVYWFRVVSHGRTAHGSMPFLGRSAIADLGAVLVAVHERLAPAIAGRRTAAPVVPAEARHGSINVNSVRGGQALAPRTTPAGATPGRSAGTTQTPCVADRAEAVFDRRFLEEEDFGEVRAEVVELLEALEREDPERRYELEDIMVVHPTRTPDGSPLTAALERSIRRVVGGGARLVASPGTYDQKHVARIAGVAHCVAYGPGDLVQAHQPDESCVVTDIVTSAKVMALATLELLAGPVAASVPGPSEGPLDG